MLLKLLEHKYLSDSLVHSSLYNVCLQRSTNSQKSTIKATCHFIHFGTKMKSAFFNTVHKMSGMKQESKESTSWCFHEILSMWEFYFKYYDLLWVQLLYYKNIKKSWWIYLLFNFNFGLSVVDCLKVSLEMGAIGKMEGGNGN